MAAASPSPALAAAFADILQGRIDPAEGIEPASEKAPPAMQLLEYLGLGGQTSKDVYCTFSNVQATMAMQAGRKQLDTMFSTLIQKAQDKEDLEEYWNGWYAYYTSWCQAGNCYNETSYGDYWRSSCLDRLRSGELDTIAREVDQTMKESVTTMSDNIMRNLLLASAVNFVGMINNVRATMTLISESEELLAKTSVQLGTVKEEYQSAVSLLKMVRTGLKGSLLRELKWKSAAGGVAGDLAQEQLEQVKKSVADDASCYDDADVKMLLYFKRQDTRLLLDSTAQNLLSYLKTAEAHLTSASTICDSILQGLGYKHGQLASQRTTSLGGALGSGLQLAATFYTGQQLVGTLSSTSQWSAGVAIVANFLGMGGNTASAIAATGMMKQVQAAITEVKRWQGLIQTATDYKVTLEELIRKDQERLEQSIKDC